MIVSVSQKSHEETVKIDDRSSFVRWATFRAAAPDLAETAAALLYRSGEGAGLLATVPGSGPPRIHPINVGIVGDGLYAFLLDSSKRRDLDLDGRYALHAHQDPHAPDEFMVRGRAIRVDDPAIRAAVAQGWFFGVDETYHLYELLLSAAMVGSRATPDDWPPRYRVWTPALEVTD